ncbi:MAG: hypothetical protein OXB94_00335 [Nitrospira sp.]|nr:hypothetical protein [Nitrospira sp.]
MLYDSRRPALRRILVLTVLCSVAAGCGVKGGPIAPEDIGIEAKIRAQRQAEEKRSTPEEPEVVLPPLQPVGTQ